MGRTQSGELRSDQIIEWCLGYGEVETSLTTNHRIERVRSALSIALQQKRQELQRDVAHYTILSKRIDGFVVCDESLE